MKRFLCAGLCALLCAGLFAGCGTTLEAEANTVYVSNKGAVTSIEVESFEQDYYDVAELEAYVNEEIDAYTEEHGKGTVKLDEFIADGKMPKLRMKYKTTKDYMDFNGNWMELYQGTVLETLEAGYTYDGNFVKVEDGKVVGSATKQEIYKEEGLKTVIIRANMDVKVDGEICYVTTENVKLNGTDSVSIREGYLLEGGAARAETAESTEGIAETTELPADEETDAGDEEVWTDVYTYIVYK